MEIVFVFLTYVVVFLLLSYMAFNYAKLKRTEFIYTTLNQKSDTALHDNYRHGVNLTQRRAIRRLILRTGWPFVIAFLVWTLWVMLCLSFGPDANLTKDVFVVAFVGGLGISGLLEIRMQVIVHDIKQAELVPPVRHRR